MKRSLCLLAAWLLPAAGAQAAAPALVPIQGVLTDSDGLALDAELEVCFSLFASESDGESLWTETQHVVFEDGLFTAYLGVEQPLDLALFRDQGELWLELELGGERLSPRLQLGSAAYAGFAEHSGHARTCDLAADAGYTAGEGIDISAEKVISSTAVPPGFVPLVSHDGSGVFYVGPNLAEKTVAEAHDVYMTWHYTCTARIVDGELQLQATCYNSPYQCDSGWVAGTHAACSYYSAQCTCTLGYNSVLLRCGTDVVASGPLLE